jgi:hypothetical protein
MMARIHDHHICAVTGGPGLSCFDQSASQAVPTVSATDCEHQKASVRAVSLVERRKSHAGHAHNCLRDLDHECSIVRVRLNCGESSPHV